MSVATDLSPVVPVPERARTPRRPDRLATVTTLHRPGEHSVAPPLRLTRRGVLVVAVAVAVLSVGLIAVAWLSAPAAAGHGGARPAPDTVTVRAGDTLWSIATRIAPERDPRAEIADLQRLNQLSGAALLPGQVLRAH